MTNGNDIVGYTLAEIALVLLFAIAVLLFPAYARMHLQNKANAGLLVHMQTELNSLRQENEEFKRRQKPEQVKATDLRSKLTPPCKEIGISSGFLFSATILASDAYLLDGKQLSIADIGTRFSPELEKARNNDCKQAVRVFYASGVPLGAYDRALRNIEQLFYVARGGPIDHVETH